LPGTVLLQTMLHKGHEIETRPRLTAGIRYELTNIGELTRSHGLDNARAAISPPAAARNPRSYKPLTQSLPKPCTDSFVGFDENHAGAIERAAHLGQVENDAMLRARLRIYRLTSDAPANCGCFHPGRPRAAVPTSSTRSFSRLALVHSRR
jgi:hypothetical protein